MAEPVLELVNITKRFPGVVALDNVNVSIYRGQVHALLGENGAGKSTLVNIIGGVYRPDSGQILLDGQPVRFDRPQDSLRLGIAIIHQELSLIPALSVAENIFLGHLPHRENMRLVDWDELHKLAREVLQRIGLEIDPTTPVRFLSTGLQQQVEIARALALEPKILVMDEPTSALTEPEVRRLFEIIEKLTADGLTVIFITHRLEEVNRIARHLTVLRDGKVIFTKSVDEITPQELAEGMLGHALEIEESTVLSGMGEPVLEVRNLTGDGRFQDVTIQVRKGEIVGIAGLLGAGKTELLRAIYGVDRIDSGEIRLEGRPISIDSPQTAIRHGIYFVPEDRKLEGLVLGMSVVENITLPYLSRLSNMGFKSYRQQASVADAFIQRLLIRTPSRDQKVLFLSGGNQQKVVLARWLSMRPRILLLDQPTRGIDIGTKEEMHQLMRELARSGVAIVFVATETPELLRVCHRIYVMRDGRIVREFDALTCSEQDLFLSAMGEQINAPN